MKILSLDAYRLLSEGGQSRIYEYDSDKVLRVPKREMDYDSIHYEFRVYRFLEGKLPVPRVHEVAECRGIPCLIMEKLEGADLFSALGKRPLSVAAIPGILARMHGSLLSLNTADSFVTNHDKARYCIGMAPHLDESLKEKLLGILDRLPGGTNLCHGDFHPGNIIESGKMRYIIDWSSASIGSPLFDIAHTYLLLMNTPRLEGVSDAVYRVQRMITGYIGKKYLKLVCGQNDIAIDSLFPYLLVKAGERCFYGMSSEQKWLRSFIERNIDSDGVRVERVRACA